MPYKANLIAKRIISILRRTLIGPYATSILCKADDFSFLISAEDFSIGRKLAFHGQYETEELRTYLDLIKKYDLKRLAVVGSHIGYFAIRLSKQLEEVYAFEPNPETFTYLSRNVWLNNCQNITLFNCAATSKDQNLNFSIIRENTGSSKVDFQGSNDPHSFGTHEVVQVAGKRVDSTGITPDFVIMDVEGHEIDAIVGLENTLPNVKVLCCELIPALLAASGKSVADQISLLEKSFSKFIIGNTDGEYKSGREVIDFFNQMPARTNHISRNIICLK